MMRVDVRFLLVFCAGFLLRSIPVCADGGVVAWDGTTTDDPALLIVAPPAPVVGPLSLDWIGPSGDGASVRASHEDGMVAIADFDGDPSSIERHAVLELLAPGRWTIEVTPGVDRADGPILALVEIGPPPGGATSYWPYLFAWVPMVGVGLFAASRRRPAST